MTAEIEVELFGIVLDAIGLTEMVNEAIEIGSSPLRELNLVCGLHSTSHWGIGTPR
jgi:hypothetical protein